MGTKMLNVSTFEDDLHDQTSLLNFPLFPKCHKAEQTVNILAVVKYRCYRIRESGEL